jgi:hypothetical protein
MPNRAEIAEQILGTSGQPVEINQLVEAVSSRAGATEDDVREVIWLLLGDGTLLLRTDRRVVIGEAVREATLA